VGGMREEMPKDRAVGGGMDKILATKGLLLPGPRKRLLSLSPFLFLSLFISHSLPPYLYHCFSFSPRH